MSFASKYGLWRLRGFKAFARHKVEKTADGWWVKTNFGTFHCPTWAAMSQMDDTWETEVRREVSSLEGRLFVDIGANIGFYSVMAARNNNYVVAIEPDQVVFHALEDNIHANSLSAKIEAHNIAGWSDNALVRFKPGRHHDTGSVSDSGISTRAMKIDDILDGRVPSLMKIDAEGSEPQILRGMPETLDAHPKIIFEALTQQKLEECSLILSEYRITKLDRTNFLAS